MYNWQLMHLLQTVAAATVFAAVCPSLHLLHTGSQGSSTIAPAAQQVVSVDRQPLCPMQGEVQGPCSIAQFRLWIDNLSSTPSLAKEHQQFLSVHVWRVGKLHHLHSARMCNACTAPVGGAAPCKPVQDVPAPHESFRGCLVCLTTAPFTNLLVLHLLLSAPGGPTT